MKNIFIAATGKDVGKSTISFALLDILQQNQQKVGFMKPVGQRWLPSPWGKVEEDVILMKDIFHFPEEPPLMNPVVIRKGFTEEYLAQLVKPKLARKIESAYHTLSQDKDYIIIEGTGHAGVGSVIDVSNATVANLLQAKVVLVVDGGIGSAIDKLELNRAFFAQHGVEITGVIVNKVLVDKADKVRNAIQKYCQKKKLQFLGLIPYSPILSHPTLGQVIDEIKPEIIHETSERRTVIDKFVVGASTLDEFVEFMREMKGNLLLVFPAVRLDIIFAIANLAKITDPHETRVHTILFSGKHKPSEIAVQTLIDAQVNILWKGGDTFTVISNLSSISIKTRPQDSYKIDEIRKIVSRNIDWQRLLTRIAEVTPTRSWLHKVQAFFDRLYQKIRQLFKKTGSAA